MADVQFTFDKSSQRFRSLETGRWVSERDLRDAVDRLADHAARRMGEVAARYRTGEITITQFQFQLLDLVKASQIAAALAAYGGRAQMTPDRWGFVGSQIRMQYLYARQMIADVLDGRQRLNGRLDARARQYGQAARSLYENIRRREGYEGGFLFERNVLHGSEHCAMCVAMTNRGAVPLGTLVPVGQRTCRGNCRCTISRYRTMSEAA